MIKLITIRPFLAMVMLCVFCLALAPKKSLHDLIANHKDTVNKPGYGKTQITKAGFNCQCDNLVATSPFTDAPGVSINTIPLIFSSYQCAVSYNHYYATHFSDALRGPPVVTIAST